MFMVGVLLVPSWLSSHSWVGFFLNYPFTVKMVAVYLAKAAFSQDLVEDEVVHIDAGQMGNTRLRPRARSIPQSAIGRSF